MNFSTQKANNLFYFNGVVVEFIKGTLYYKMLDFLKVDGHFFKYLQSKKPKIIYIKYCKVDI